MRRALLVALAALAAHACPARAADPQLLGALKLSPRLEELTLRTPELAAPTHVRVLLPAGYDRASRRRYPVLYLLHGANDDYQSWTRAGKGEAERLTAGLPLIVVMPDAGRGGFYTDWFNNGRGGLPRWETWHVDRLIPFVDRRYRTKASRAGRAVAGLSMGGFGAMTYATRHPDLFTAVASFSGAVDTSTPPGVGPAVIDAIAGADGGAPGSLWGPRATQEIRWRAHNPWDLAGNLRGLAVTIRTGNGEPGGPFGGTGSVDAIEAAVHAMGVGLHDRLRALGIGHVWEDYGPGWHLWPYWNRDLERTLPWLMERFRHAGRAPSPFSFTAAEPRYVVYGWSVRVDRPAMEFSSLERASRRGFTLAGSGSATVTTARLYRPGARYRVRVGARRRAVRASAAGRLRIAVPLGPGNRRQEFTAGAETRVFRTTVTIARR
jgi:S-formylglutathione hydrolase FrmB